MDAAEVVAGDVLRTERLVLSLMAPAHAGALHPLLNDWDVIRMLANVPGPLSRRDVEAFAERQQRPARENDDYIVLFRDAPVGVCGVKRPGSGNPPRKMPRLGYWIGRPFWGRGFASEALTALVAGAFARFPHDTIGAGVFHDNPASRRVLEKLGFRAAGQYETPCLSRGVPVLTTDMHLARAAWQGVRQ